MLVSYTTLALSNKRLSLSLSCKRPAPAADESATRGVFPPGAPPTSPSTVTMVGKMAPLCVIAWEDGEESPMAEKSVQKILV